MPKSLNKAQIIGHLGQDPELRYAGSGTAVCNLRVETNQTWTSDGTARPEPLLLDANSDA